MVSFICEWFMIHSKFTICMETFVNEGDYTRGIDWYTYWALSIQSQFHLKKVELCIKLMGHAE